MDPDGEVRADLDETRRAAERSADLTRQLLAFARKQTVAPRVLDLNDTVAGMLKMMQRLIGEDIDLSWSPGAGLWTVKLDPSQVDQILANLCVNARDAIGGVGKVTIETCNLVLDEPLWRDRPGPGSGSYVTLSVVDDGCGMDKETLERIFDPFFTTKEVGRGTGLGLATVYGIVRQNDGYIRAFSEPGRGTVFTIYLPRYEGSIEEIEGDDSRAMFEGAGETVLVVEDETAILDPCTAVLAHLGYRVLAAGTPGEALLIAKEQPAGIDLLMTDVIMPEMNGRELADRISRVVPGLRTLYMSGYDADVISSRGVLEEEVCFIQKPFSVRDIAAKVHDALARPEGK